MDWLNYTFMMYFSMGIYGALLCFILHLYLSHVIASMCVKNGIVMAPLGGDGEGDKMGRSRRVLLVISHPDDESMFFTPLLSTLKSNEVDSYILCLSNGNYDGLGAIREKELLAAGPILGVPSDNISIINSASMKDGMQEAWDEGVVAGFVRQAVLKYQITDLYTFDGYGVSGHPNHIATYNGVREAVRIGVLGAGTGTVVSAWKLESVNIIRKYLAFIELLFVNTKSMDDHSGERQLFGVSELFISWAAMSAHASQFTWYPYFFRKIFVFISRYSYLNGFSPIDVHSTKETAAHEAEAVRSVNKKNV